MSDLEQVKAMSDAELDAAIRREILCVFIDGVLTRPVFAIDLNSVAEVEAKLKAADLVGSYAEALRMTCPGNDWSRCILAPARQRAEACLIAWRRMNENEVK